MVTDLKDLNKERDEVERKYNLLASIATVYFTLRKFYRIPERSVTVEEYYSVREKLEELGKEAVNVWWRRALRYIGFRTSWHKFLEDGYFGSSTPFSSWDVVNKFFTDGSNSASLYRILWGSELKWFLEEPKVYINFRLFPPNFIALMSEIENGQYSPVKSPQA